MKLSRRLRSLAAFLTLVGVLMSQLALAAYACPGAQAMAPAAVEFEAGGEMPCHGDVVPPPQSALCAAHCQQGDQALDKPAAAAAVPALMLVAIVPGPAVPVVATAGSPPGEQRSLLARATAPSLAVRHCCFRV